MKLTGWNQAQVAELMWAYTAKDVSVLQLKHALATMISRRQHKWNYSGALAALFGLPLPVLVGEDLRTYSLGKLQRQFGFSRAGVLRHAEAEAKKDARWRAAVREDVIGYFHELSHAMLNPDAQKVSCLHDDPAHHKNTLT
ncbi:hypothetical protein [Paraburkholderia sp. MM5384-R2]|uniref:hypothetical protein n=1 Tax=Paraburkholderia sp. MM5384-R2 TaxID=2723097 RepID=UPI0016225130|nr:hypothetical protein [Paraburkholderia sp. MM5384-R2]MBB5496881.1 hypothetical protein [Paraburkholderia sp. MM5384-R2]